MELISVIIPVYNAEKYLDDCIHSVLSQTYPHFECILVDDGSTDDSGDICDRYAAEDSRVRVIHQPNRGVSAARNLGLDTARGEYIAFVDADDLLHSRYLELLLGGMTPECDAVVCGFQRFEDGAAPSPEEPLPVPGYAPLTRLEALGLLNQWRSAPALEMVIPWNKLYRKSLFSGLRFPLGVRHEDEFIAHQLLHRCRALARYGAPLYYYRWNPDSYMGGAGQEQSLAHLVFFEALTQRIAFFRQNQPSLVTGAVHRLLRECNSFYDAYREMDDPAYREKLPWLVALYRREYLRYFRCIDNGERLKGALFAFCPALYHRLSSLKWKREGNE